MSSSKFPPSLNATGLPSGLSEELKAAALVPIDALLLQLLPLSAFAEVVLQQDQRELKPGLLFLHLQDAWLLREVTITAGDIQKLLAQSLDKFNFQVMLVLCFIDTSFFSQG